MISNADKINKIDVDSYNRNLFETKMQIEHIFKAICELYSTIFMLTVDENDPNYKINMSIIKEIRSLYGLMVDIIENDILSKE